MKTQEECFESGKKTWAVQADVVAHTSANLAKNNEATRPSQRWGSTRCASQIDEMQKMLVHFYFQFL